MRVAIIFLGSLVLTAIGAFGHFVFAGLPGAGDYVPSDAMTATVLGVSLVAGVGAGALGLFLLAQKD